MPNSRPRPEGDFDIENALGPWSAICRVHLRKVSRFSVELVLIPLNVPTLKHAPCCGVWVAVEHLCLTEIHTMACSECMFCQCRSSHVTISEGTPMLL